MFHWVSKHKKTDISAKSQAECFYILSVFGNSMKHETCVLSNGLLEDKATNLG